MAPAICHGIIKVVVCVKKFTFFPVNIGGRVFEFTFFFDLPPPFSLGASVPFPSFLVRAVIAVFDFASSWDSFTIVLVKEEIVSRSDDAAETKISGASYVSALTASCASVRSAASRRHKLA